MKYFFATLPLFFWFLFTFLLTISMIGILIIREDEWLSIPHKLIKVFE